jgi:SAM-dependent methyltransferase
MRRSGEEHSAPDLRHTAGAAWVDRYLDPLLQSAFGRPTPRLDCLHIWADDDDEASQLRRNGHRCTVLLPDLATYHSTMWRRLPVIGPLDRGLPFVDSAFDVVFTGAFGRLARTPQMRAELARELARVVRARGALLLSVANRYCPVDLQDRSSLLHGPSHPEKAGLAELTQVLSGAGFSRVDRLSVRGHFGWRRLPAALRPCAAAFEQYLGTVSAPERPWLYGSPFNPVLMLWSTR